MSDTPFEYEVAISFAMEDKAVAEELFQRLMDRKLTVFLDEYTTAEPWARDVLDHLVNLYARKARYCLLLISKHYPLKSWSGTDRLQVQERAFRDAQEYILPVLLDDIEIPGLSETKGYQDLRQRSLEGIVDFIVVKRMADNRHSGPPPQSHDLRSGNVPPAHPEADESSTEKGTF